MEIRTDWLICITVAEDPGSCEAPFVEVADEGIEELDEIVIRTEGKLSRMVEKGGRTCPCFSRKGISMLHEALGAYLAAAEQRDEEE